MTLTLVEEVDEKVINECRELYIEIENKCFEECKCVDCICYEECIMRREEKEVDNICYRLKEKGLI